MTKHCPTCEHPIVYPWMRPAPHIGGRDNEELEAHANAEWARFSKAHPMADQWKPYYSEVNYQVFCRRETYLLGYSDGLKAGRSDK